MKKKYLLKFEVISRHPHSEGHIEDTFEKTISIWPWQNLEEAIFQVEEELQPFGYWSDVNLISTTKI